MTTAEPVVSVEIDQEADAAYVQLSTGQVARTVGFNDDVNIDLDEHGVVVGIELLDLGSSVPLDDIARHYHIRTEALRVLLESLVRGRPSQTTVAGSTVATQLPFGAVQPSHVVPA
ncbi:MAG: DUF2283 domain-containing protein [Pseudonocardiaceae bacterium]